MIPARVGAVATTYEHLALDQQLCFALHTASRAVTRAYAPLLERAGLTYPQYVTMLALWERAGEPLTVGALGSRLRLETGTLTPLLKRLEALGYVRRTRDRADERRSSSSSPNEASRCATSWPRCRPPSCKHPASRSTTSRGSAGPWWSWCATSTPGRPRPRGPAEAGGRSGGARAGTRAGDRRPGSVADSRPRPRVSDRAPDLAGSGGAVPGMQVTGTSWSRNLAHADRCSVRS